MSNQRYIPKFRAEAVRQVLDRGYSVADMAEWLGVFAMPPWFLHIPRG